MNKRLLSTSLLAVAALLFAGCTSSVAHPAAQELPAKRLPAAPPAAKLLSQSPKV